MERIKCEIDEGINLNYRFELFFFFYNVVILYVYVVVFLMLNKDYEKFKVYMLGI